MNSLQTANESLRLADCEVCQIIDTSPNDCFQDLVKLAAQICEMPFAVVTLMDEDRLWYESSVTPDNISLPIDPSFYTHTFLHEEVLQVPDALSDERFATSRMVASSPHIRFYAGTLFKTVDGRTQGTLSVMDTRPRQLSAAQLEALRVLTHQVVMQLELHRHAESLKRLNDHLNHESCERTGAESILRDSQEQYRQLFEEANDCIYTTDLDGKYTSANYACERVTGYTREEILNLNASQVVVPEHLDRAISMATNKLAGNDHKQSYEIDIFSKDGRRITVDLSTQLIRRDGRVIGIQGIARDITERKHAALALRDSEERYRELFEEANDLLYTHDLSGRFTSLNKSGERITGYTREEAMQMNITDVIAPEYVALAREMATCKTADKIPTIYTLEINAKQGHRVVLEVSTRLIRRGDSIEVQGTARDVTERERTEEGLRKAEEKYRNIFENAVEGIFQSTLEGRFISVNPAMARIFGYESPDELLAGLTDIERQYYVAPGDRQKLRRALAEHDIVHGFESQAYRRDGSKIWVLENVRAMRDADGALLHYEGILEDVTERKRVEEALQNSERYFRSLIENGSDLITVLERDGTIRYESPSLKRVLGYEPAERIGHSPFGLIHPDDMTAATDMFTRVIQNPGMPLSMECRFRHQDDSWRMLEVNGINLLDDAAVAGIIVNSHDITKRKRAEEWLREVDLHAIKEYERLVERIAFLAQTLGAARDLQMIYRATADFASSSTPCTGVFISLYDSQRQTRTAVYARSHGQEEDVSALPTMQMSKSPHSRAVATGTVVIEEDFQTIIRDQPIVYIGFDIDPRPTQSALVVPMLIMGRTIGAIEVQSVEPGAFNQAHATTMQMAANLAASAIENVRLIEQEHVSAEQLRQSQKMEAVGQLAGGIAHDFNNLLTAINGYSDLLLRRLPETDPMCFKVSEIRKAGERAASLTRQLLAFSRKQVLQPVVLDLNVVVSDMDKMLRRLIGEDIELLVVLEPDLCPVKADHGQIEQVLMNLVVNARDAMPSGGKLTIETSIVHPCEKNAQQQQPVAGRRGNHVRIVVSDTGTGMDAATRERIFEPFFTTKETGKGTGLGLSMAYGIIKQSDGHVRVESEAGRGTTFEIFLPCLEETSEEPAATERCEAVWSCGSETVLLVEDDETVREMTREVLELSGYEVLVAEDGEHALEICRSSASHIDVVLTDVIMPRMSGKQMADLIGGLGYTSTPVLFMSGYTADAIAHHGVLEDGVNFLQKPFTPEVLVRKVRAVLDAR